MSAPRSVRPIASAKRIRDYEIWGRLGEGGMSEVWLARHVVLGTPVILKTVRTAFARDEAGVPRVLREARLMARIPNPRIVRALDAGEYEGQPYLVQEYVDGIDLAELDRRRRTSLGVGLPLWFVCEAMEAACDALHSAHQNGVIHRDVKPSNLFGSPESGIRLGDFGIAVDGHEARRHELSGTVKFMAPEQLRGAEPDRQADVWGAGATAFDLRYGFAPFPDANAVLDDTRPIPFPDPATPAEAYFQKLLRMMLARDRAARPEDVLDTMRHFQLLRTLLRSSHRRGSFAYVDRHTFRVDECTIGFQCADIADATADAIVSSANWELKMRSGCGEALRRRGGDVIEEEARRNGEQPLGSCVVTGAGALKAKRVLHAVSAWNEASCVGRAMQRALLVADELGLRSLAIAALGTGAAGVSIEASANAMMTALRHHLLLGGTRLRRVDVVIAEQARVDRYREVAEDALRGGGDGHTPPDLGLPHFGEVQAEGATAIDARKTS
jgi:serine/threonine-protein kinase